MGCDTLLEDGHHTVTDEVFTTEAFLGVGKEVLVQMTILHYFSEVEFAAWGQVVEGVEVEVRGGYGEVEVTSRGQAFNRAQASHHFRKM